jgi:hypothetical protein
MSTFGFRGRGRLAKVPSLPWHVHVL